MSRITRVLVPAMLVSGLCGMAASSASATEDPYYKVAGSRLKATHTEKIEVSASGNQVFKVTASGVTVTCTGMAVKSGATINGSESGEPGTSTSVIEYSGCTAGTCTVTGGKIVTSSLKGELVLASSTVVKGTKDLNLLTPVSGSLFMNVSFSNCSGITVEGNLLGEVLNSKKGVVAFEENEKEEEFGFIRDITGGEACKLKEGKFVECKKASLKAGGVAGTLEGVAEVKLVSKNPFGVFSK